MKTIGQILEAFPNTTANEWTLHESGSWVHRNVVLAKTVRVEGGYCVFRGGIFHGGVFRGGIFHGGIFYGGTFHGGYFNGGNFRAGHFNGGAFYGGAFRGGIFHGGTFHGGTFYMGEYILPDAVFTGSPIAVTGVEYDVHLYEGTDMIQIGCTCLSVAMWDARFDELAKEHCSCEESEAEVRRAYEFVKSFVKKGE